MTNIKSEIYEELNVDRVLVFLETGPQTNKYQQIYFTGEEFKKMSRTIGTIVKKVGNLEHIALNLSPEVFALPDLEPIHEPKTI